jgi:hypothetical protein
MGIELRCRIRERDVRVKTGTFRRTSQEKLPRAGPASLFAPHERL